MCADILSLVVTLAAVLWCFGSHIYGVSEGQWRLLPGPARRVCRRVKCRPSRSYLTKEACTETWTLAGSRDSKRERPHQQSKPGWGKSPKVHCPSRPSPPRSQRTCLVLKDFFSPSSLVPALPLEFLTLTLAQTFPFRWFGFPFPPFTPHLPVFTV